MRYPEGRLPDHRFCPHPKPRFGVVEHDGRITPVDPKLRPGDHRSWAPIAPGVRFLGDEDRQ